MTKKSKLRFNIKKEINKTFKITFMKLKDLVIGDQSIANLSAQKLPVAVSYKISVFIKKMQPELTSFNEKKNELVKEYGTVKLNEEGKETENYEFKGENIAKFNEKIEELLDQDVAIEVPDIKLADLGDITIEPRNLINIAWLIKE